MGLREEGSSGAGGGPELRAGVGAGEGEVTGAGEMALASISANWI